MKKGIIFIVILALMAIYAFNFNNNAVVLKESATKTWGNVENSYQRRNDLIGNLVKTVQGAADFEKGTLEAVIKARAEATKTTINAGDLTSEKMAAFEKAQSGLSGALSKLMVVVERYPDLKANQNFLKLQDELASTENQILTARTRFNEAVEPYNNHVKKLPGKLIAGILGFKPMDYFKSVEGADKPVDVEFDLKN